MDCRANMKDKTITYLEEISRIYLKPWMQGKTFLAGHKEALNINENVLLNQGSLNQHLFRQLLFPQLTRQTKLINYILSPFRR